MIKAIVGANWGDEGKGKLIDYLTEEADVVVRFQGGNNAGHTVINHYGKFALHLIPSGVFYENVVNILGPGVALNVDAFLGEIEMLKERGVPVPNLYVSDRAQIILPWHKKFDEYEEERLKDNAFGSTKCGIAPFYSDKYLKIGIQVSELFDEEVLRERLHGILEIKNFVANGLYKKDSFDFDTVLEKLIEQREKIKPYVIDTTVFLHKAIKENKNILLEGQLGSLKDPDHGIYPFVTSSSPLAGYAAVGAGVPPWAIKEILAVTKAYSSSVGAGEFVSEIFGEEAETLRQRGGDNGEYGATTGRPRRVGWFDAVATRYGCMVQGATSVAITCIDVLGYLDEIQVCVGYEINGEVTKDFPVTSKLKNAKPVLKTLKGWKTDVSSIRNYEELPQEAKDYISFIEEFIEVPIKIVSVGSKREAIILK